MLNGGPWGFSDSVVLSLFPCFEGRGVVTLKPKNPSDMPRISRVLKLCCPLESAEELYKLLSGFHPPGRDLDLTVPGCSLARDSGRPTPPQVILRRSQHEDSVPHHTILLSQHCGSLFLPLPPLASTRRGVRLRGPVDGRSDGS